MGASNETKQATEAVGRRVVVLDRLAAHLRNKAARARIDGDEEYGAIISAEVSAVEWAIPIVQRQVEAEVAVAIEREAMRKKFGVHRLPDAQPIDPDHARALTHALGLRTELEKMKVRMPHNDQAHLALLYARLIDAVIAAIEEHALGYYWEQITTPPRMVLRNDGAIVLDRNEP